MCVFRLKSLLLVTLVLLCQIGLAQQGLKGKVSGVDGKLAGALIKLVDTKLGTVTNDDGSFEIKDVPEGQYQLRISYAGFEEKLILITVQKGKETEIGSIALKDNSHAMKEVTVKGKANNGSNLEALKMTKNSTKIVTVLSAENIGKLPDKNVAEAVQRAAGVKLEHNKGEGSTVALRGTPTDWTATFVNGDRLPTSDEDDPSRTFHFEVFPSQLVDNIIVTRTVTPDLDADNIGGAINFQTVTPPTKKVFNIDLGAGMNVRAGKPLYDINFTYGNTTKDKKFSYVLSGSYYQRAYATDAMRMVYGSNYSHEINALELKDYFGTRKTLGANAAVEYKPNSRLTLGAHFMHGRMDDDKWQYKTTYNWADGEGQRMRDIGTHGVLQRRLYGGDVTASWNVSDKFKLDAKVASYYNSFRYGPFPYGKGDPRNGYVTFNFINSIEKTFYYNDFVNTDFYGKMPSDPSVKTTPYVLLDGDNPYGTGPHYDNIHPTPNYLPGTDQYYLESITSQTNNTWEKDPVSAQVNGTWTLNDKVTLKAGLKFRAKQGSREISEYSWYPNTGEIQNLRIWLNQHETQDPPRNSTFLNAMSGAYAGQLMPFLTPSAMTGLIGNLGDSLKGYAMDQYNNNYYVWVGSKYHYQEQVSAGYAMAEAKLGKWELVGGLRIENTHFVETGDTQSTQGQMYTTPDGTTSVWYFAPESRTVDRNYLAILPSLNANYSIDSKSDLRLAVSRTFHRPNFEETKPGAPVIRFEDLEFNFGNPNLKPTYSLNFDATYQRYWGKGLMTFGLYYKNVTDHIFTRMEADTDPVSGIIYKYYENAGNSYIMGAEASIDRKFDFLHGFWSGFGVYANVTYSYARMQVPGRPSSQAMTEQTPWLYNIALYYEKGRVNTRLGLNYTGAYLKELNLASVAGYGILHKDTDYDLFVGETYSLDYQLAVTVSKHMSVFGEANNLLNAPYKTYIGQPWRPRRIEYYGPRFEVGVKFNL
ncbi:TonB-dependent receptor [Taibaiella soli]|uniref:TonB-dependent receptor n=1 Tax=Taibaiella soli TaxID=1649169 RepID=A0A2W2BK75_9BACT|nr:TonB-dependent receptor [Taibaiella soli]PZF73866.1 hypothetical protein DN068_05860 [Taibaiella soli]